MAPRSTLELKAVIIDGSPGSLNSEDFQCPRNSIRPQNMKAMTLEIFEKT